MGVTSRKKGDTHFCKQIFASLFRELSDYTEDVEKKWDLFISAVITPAAASCGCKDVGGQMGSEKRTPWLNLKKLFCKEKLGLELG